MRTRNEDDVLSVHAIAGTHCVLLGLDVKKGYGQPMRDDTSTDLSVMLFGMALDSDGCRNGECKKVAATITTRAASTGVKVKDTSKAVFIGFAIEREDTKTKQRVSLNGGGPIQKFHFGDYTVLPGKEYVYTVRRMVTSRSKFVAFGSPVVVRISAVDPTKGTHGIYFNRGVAGSKAYTEKFGEFRKFTLVKKFGTCEWKSIINPRAIPDKEKSKEALAWLSRGLEEALLQFISQASGEEYQLLATVYEFTHEETIQAFASAVERGVNVKIIRHCKGSHRAKVKRNDIVKDESGNVVKDWIPDGPTEEAKKAIDAVGFTSLKHAHIWHHDTFIERTQGSGIMHNKFIILVKNSKPVQVWTGSTNSTDSGIYGQSNVGHIVRDSDVASQFQEYWDHLSQDLPGRKHSKKTEDVSGKEPMDVWNERQTSDLQGPVKSRSIQVIFSPRKTIDMLQWFADRMGNAKSSVHFTEAFGIAQPIAQILNQGRNGNKSSLDEGLRRSPRIARRHKEKDASDDSFLRFVLLDNKPSEHSSKKSRASAEKKGTDFVDYYDFKDNPFDRIAFGAILANDDHDANGESLTGLTSFVDYIHTKYLIVDALTDNPLVITGSANFSAASTEKVSWKKMIM